VKKMAQKTKAPMPQTMRSTPKSAKESKTARPVAGRKMDTPRTKVAPPVPERKRSPKY
jgi:hypothetical protein